jgi:hypothetical protein
VESLSARTSRRLLVKTLKPTIDVPLLRPSFFPL